MCVCVCVCAFACVQRERQQQTRQLCGGRSEVCRAGHRCGGDPPPAELPPAVAPPSHGAQVHDTQRARLPRTVHLPGPMSGAHCSQHTTLMGVKEIGSIWPEVIKEV